MYLRFTYCHYYNRSFDKHYYAAFSPLETSLYRLKQKLMWNFAEQRLQDKMEFKFCTLTISDQYYDQLCKSDETLSGRIRKWLTLVRNKLKRQHYTFKCIWRIEEGSQGTKRLHLHTFMHTNMPIPAFKQFIQQHWIYADWEKLNRDPKMRSKWFQSLDSSNLAMIYACKYAAKSKSSPEMKNGQDVKTHWQVKRLYGFPRLVTPIPLQWKMEFNWDVKIWQKKLKENWRSMPNNPSEHVNIINQRLRISEDYYEFAPWQKNEITRIQGKENSSLKRCFLHYVSDLPKEEKEKLDKKYDFLAAEYGQDKEIVAMLPIKDPSVEFKIQPKKLPELLDWIKVRDNQNQSEIAYLRYKNNLPIEGYPIEHYNGKCHYVR